MNVRPLVSWLGWRFFFEIVSMFFVYDTCSEGRQRAGSDEVYRRFMNVIPLVSWLGWRFCFEMVSMFFVYDTCSDEVSAPKRSQMSLIDDVRPLVSWLGWRFCFEMVFNVFRLWYLPEGRQRAGSDEVSAPKRSLMSLIDDSWTWGRFWVGSDEDFALSFQCFSSMILARKVASELARMKFLHQSVLWCL